jgi:hypothetical protein
MMSIAQYLAAAAGVLVLSWPYIPAAIRSVFLLLDGPPPVVKPLNEVVAPNYRDAIFFLAQVRFRLVTSGGLSEDTKRAIDVLTLALVDGSDK